MGYRELLQALEDEVGRQVRQLRAEASEERQRLLDATRRELAAKREAALEEERRRLQGERARALLRARLEQERAILGETRRRMAELQREAQVRLSALNDTDLLTRLVDEVVPELGEGPLEFRVDEGHAEHLRDHLSRHHPDLLPRATINAFPDVRGGVEVSLGGRQLLDNTLPSRLQNAWPLLEPEIVAILFTEGAATPHLPERRESVGVASASVEARLCASSVSRSRRGDGSGVDGGRDGGL